MSGKGRARARAHSGARARRDSTPRGFAFAPETALAHLRANDPGIGRLIDRVGDFRMRIERTQTVFAALSRAIVYQQLSGKAAAAIYARVCTLSPRSRAGLSAAHVLVASDGALRRAGLSRAKASALRDLAKKSLDGDIPSLSKIRRMDDEAVIEALTRVRGVGRWTVEMFLMFRLGRADVLPVQDYGIRKGFAAAFEKSELPSPEVLASHGERWRPYRTVASWYLWRALDEGRKKP